jgi:hypothetical protein
MVKETAVADTPKQPASEFSTESANADPDTDERHLHDGEHRERAGAGLIQPVGKPLTPSPDLVGKPVTPSPDLVGKPLTPSPERLRKPLTPSPE